MKPEVHENIVDGFKIAEVTRYNASKSEDEQNRMKECIDYKKERQSDNYDVTGETLIPLCLNYSKSIMRLEMSVKKNCFDMPPVSFKNYQVFTNSVGKSNVLDNKTKPKDHTETRLNGNYVL